MIVVTRGPSLLLMYPAGRPAKRKPIVTGRERTGCHVILYYVQLLIRGVPRSSASTPHTYETDQTALDGSQPGRCLTIPLELVQKHDVEYPHRIKERRHQVRHTAANQDHPRPASVHAVVVSLQEGGQLIVVGRRRLVGVFSAHPARMSNAMT